MACGAPLKRFISLVSACPDGGTLPYLSLDLVNSGTGKLNPGSDVPARPAAESGAALVQSGDVLFGKLRPYLAKSLLVTEPSYASTELLALRPGSRIDDRFLGYLVRSEPFVAWTVASSEGSKMPRTSWEKVGDFMVELPTLVRQGDIADYLDAETARIDALITKKRRMIKLLDIRWKESAQQQLISHSAGRVPMRRLLLRPPQYGASLSGSPTCPEGGIRYLRITDLESDGLLREDDPRYLTPAEAQPFILDFEDLLFARSGATSGKAFRYSQRDSKAAFAGYLIRVAFDHSMILPELVEIWTQTSDYWGQIREAAVQATIENVSAERYKELLVPVPSVASQTMLVNRLQKERTHAGHLGSKLEKQIELLVERRQALITAAVTGELAIPGVAA